MYNENLTWFKSVKWFVFVFPGTTGPIGLVGSPGAPGSGGDKGLNGAQGMKGVGGLSGVVGERGIRGEPGLQVWYTRLIYHFSLSEQLRIVFVNCFYKV